MQNSWQNFSTQVRCKIAFFRLVSSENKNVSNYTRSRPNRILSTRVFRRSRQKWSLSWFRSVC